MANDIDSCLRLWATVMYFAVNDLFSNSDRAKRSARAWFASKDHRPGAFLWCCDALSLNGVAVRERILNGTLRRGSALRRYVKRREKEAAKDEDPSEAM